MNIDLDVGAEHVALVAVFGNAVDAGEGIRRDRVPKLMAIAPPCRRQRAGYRVS
jgi:hypothetical protein